MGKKLFTVGALILVAAAVAALVVRNETGSRPAASILISPSSTSVASGAAHMRVGQRRIASSLTWRVLSSYTTRRIKNQYLSSQASGIYLVVDVAAVNDTNHAVALNRARLKLNASAYPLDATALSALELAGHKALSATLRPGATASGWLVFDVRPSGAASTARLCLTPPAASNAALSAGCSTA
jgi:uncharacterized protein DUF4352